MAKEVKRYECEACGGTWGSEDEANRCAAENRRNEEAAEIRRRLESVAGAIEDRLCAIPRKKAHALLDEIETLIEGTRNG